MATNSKKEANKTQKKDSLPGRSSEKYFSTEPGAKVHHQWEMMHPAKPMLTCQPKGVMNLTYQWRELAVLAHLQEV
jgi:hypothetical protein